MSQPIPDVAIPVVFPDFLIRVDTPPVNVGVPDLPFIDIPGIPDRVKIPGSQQKVPYLGHAGALFFEGVSGMTKYYEYGRYDSAALGIVRKVTVPNVKMNTARPTKESLFALLTKVSRSSGQGGRIVGAYIPLAPGMYHNMLAYAEKRLKENTNPKRNPYDLFLNSCNHFMKGTCNAGYAGLPPVAIPNPAGYIHLVRQYFPNLDYSSTALKVPSLGY
jgi:hypothetical protein